MSQTKISFPKLRKLKKSVLPSEKDLFLQAMEAFCTELGRLGSIRASDLSRARSKLAAELASNHYINSFAFRAKVYPEFAHRIGQEFLQTMKSIVAPCISQFSDEYTVPLLKQLNASFQGGLGNALESERRYAASIGRSNERESYLGPVKSIFEGEAARATQELLSYVKQHNLHSLRTASQERRKGLFGIIKSIASFIFSVFRKSAGVP